MPRQLFLITSAKFQATFSARCTFVAYYKSSCTLFNAYFTYNPSSCFLGVQLTANTQYTIGNACGMLTSTVYNNSLLSSTGLVQLYI